MDFLSDELKKLESSTSPPGGVRDVIRLSIKDIDDHSACLKHGIENCSDDVDAKVRDAARANVYTETGKIMRSFISILNVACRPSESE